jgi:V8-like Glu-specific endopeptidase
LHSYYLQHCDKEEKAEISSISASQEEKEPIFTATIADCKGLFQEGPSEITTPEKYPYSAVGMVLSKTKHCKIIGTGCLIGPNIVLTCAHNLYDTKSR